MKKLIILTFGIPLLVSCSKPSFCECVKKTTADQLEYEGKCAYLNEMAPDEFDVEISKCEMELMDYQ